MIKSLAAVLALAIALPACDKATASKTVTEAPKASSPESIQIEVNEENFRRIVRLERKIRQGMDAKNPDQFADWSMFSKLVFNPMREGMINKFGKEQVEKWGVSANNSFDLSPSDL